VSFWANLLWNDSHGNTDRSVPYETHLLVNGEDGDTYYSDDDADEILQAFERIPALVEKSLAKYVAEKQSAEEKKRLHEEQQAAYDLAQKQKAQEQRERA
jgi:hypothetical protein